LPSQKQACSKEVFAIEPIDYSGALLIAEGRITLL